MHGEEDNDYYDDITQQTTVMTGDDTRGSIVQWTTHRELYIHTAVAPPDLEDSSTTFYTHFYNLLQPLQPLQPSTTFTTFYNFYNLYNTEIRSQKYSDLYSYMCNGREYTASHLPPPSSLLHLPTHLRT